MCRSRRELSNEYLLAKIGVDTAENEPLEVWGKLIQIIQHYLIVSLGTSLEDIMGALDIDHDGRVTWAEFSNYCLAKLGFNDTKA